MSFPAFFFRRSASVLVILAFLAAITLQILPKRTANYYELKVPLSELLPPSLPGWTFEDVPIASTPEVAEAVDELLNFSEGIYRIYRGPANREIKVYIAYWIPGKMDPRLVGVHSPDVCWVGAGWKQIGEKRRRSLVGIDGTGLINGHDRTFEIQGQREEVVFWHLVGGGPSRYLEPIRSGASWWTASEIFRNPFAPRYEQFFVRISSTGNLDGVSEDPMMARIVTRLSVVQNNALAGGGK